MLQLYIRTCFPSGMRYGIMIWNYEMLSWYGIMRWNWSFFALVWHFNINKNIYCMSHYILYYVYWWTLHLCLFTLINCGRKWLLVFSNLCNHQLFILSIILYLCLVTYVTFESLIWQIYYPLSPIHCKKEFITHKFVVFICVWLQEETREVWENIECERWVV